MARAGSYIAEVEWKRMEKLYDLIRPKIDDFAEQMREEGRREILAEIAAAAPTPPGQNPEHCYCSFCGGFELFDEHGGYDHHKDCLWFRAHSLTPKE